MAYQYGASRNTTVGLRNQNRILAERLAHAHEVIRELKKRSNAPQATRVKAPYVPFTREDLERELRRIQIRRPEPVELKRARLEEAAAEMNRNQHFQSGYANHRIGATS